MLIRDIRRHSHAFAVHSYASSSPVTWQALLQSVWSKCNYAISTRAAALKARSLTPAPQLGGQVLRCAMKVAGLLPQILFNLVFPLLRMKG